MIEHRSRLLPPLAAIALALAMTACNVPTDPRGNLPTEAQLKEITAGVTDKASVTRILGSPSSVAPFDNDTWYYISQKTKEVAFFRPELLDQEVVAVEFDKGLVRDVRFRRMNDRVAVVPNPNITPAPGREFTVWEQLLGNFGRFSGASSTRPTGGNPDTGPGH